MVQLHETIDDIQKGVDLEAQQMKNLDPLKLQNMMESVRSTVENIRVHQQNLERDYSRVQVYCKDLQLRPLDDEKLNLIQEVYVMHESEYIPELTKWDRYVRDAVIYFSDSKGQLFLSFKSRIRSIAHYQSLVASVNPLIDNLQSAIKSQSDALMQLLHVHRMGPAWGATLVEIVRRKEYVKIFIQKAKLMAEILSQYRSLEQKRRETFKAEIIKYIPTGLVSGMDDPTPFCEVSISNTKDNLPNITIEDINLFEHLVSRLKASNTSEYGSKLTSDSISKLHVTMIKMLPQIEEISMEFDRIVYKTGLISKLKQSDEDHRKNSITSRPSTSFSPKLGRANPTVDENIKAYETRIRSLERLLQENYHKNSDSGSNYEKFQMLLSAEKAENEKCKQELARLKDENQKVAKLD